MFYMPVKIYEEPGCVWNHREELAALGSKALIVTGRGSAKKNGSLDDVMHTLEAEGRPFVLFDEVEENPSVETVTRAASLANGADFVIGIGGGSPMDAAKAIAYMLKHPGQDPVSMYDRHADGSAVPVAAVPTTCGTGSEATAVAVLTRHDLQTKQSIVHKVFPALSLVDGKYLKTAPLPVIRDTAVDALAHLWESWLNTKATDYSRMFVQSGLEVWRRSLPVLRGEKDAEKQDLRNLMNAATFGGMAIAHTGTSIPHALSYEVTYHLGVKHGRAVGMFQAGYMGLAEEADRNALLSMAGFGSLKEFEAFFDLACGRPELPEELAVRIAEHVAADTSRTSLCPYPVDPGKMLRIVRWGR